MRERPVPFLERHGWIIEVSAGLIAGALVFWLEERLRRGQWHLTWRDLVAGAIFTAIVEAGRAWMLGRWVGWLERRAFAPSFRGLRLRRPNEALKLTSSKGTARDARRDRDQAVRS